jgi:ABC-type polysaccharide/polyol phosphate export permease
MVEPGSSGSGSLDAADMSAKPEEPPARTVGRGPSGNGSDRVADLTATPEEPKVGVAPPPPITKGSVSVTSVPVAPEEPPESVPRPPPSGGGTLVVIDVSAIPDEPPEESIYHHKKGLIEAARLVWQNREIIHTLAERDFKAQYKDATLGILWAVLSPVATLGVLVIVFSRVKGFHTQGIPYPLYAFVGILCWGYFAASLGGGGASLLANKALLSKTQFPRECFPLETMVLNAINTTMSLVPLTILFVIFGRAPTIATLWVPLFVLIELVFAVGVVLAVSGLIIQARDLVQVLPLVISLGIFATPVIWPFALIPTHVHVAGGHRVIGLAGAHHWVGGFYVNFQAVYGFFNPLGPVIANVRQTMLLGRAPTWTPLIAAIVGSIIYFLAGYKIFRRFEVDFADIV